jgi:Mycobacterium 19 kDa lipoprotein antigen
MKMLGVVAVVMALAPLPMAAAHAGGSWSAIVNGQELAHGDEAKQVSCGHDPIHIVVGYGSGIFANLAEGTLEVRQISIGPRGGGTTYLYDPKQTVYGSGGGDAQATQSGKTYKITGHIAPYLSAQGQILKNATPVPLEFDVTCP